MVTLSTEGILRMQAIEYLGDQLACSESRLLHENSGLQLRSK